MKKLMLWAIPFLGIAFFSSCNKNGEGFGIWESGPTRVAIQPFGKISQAQVDSVQSAVERMYEFEVVILDRVELPKMAFTEIRYPRYRADSIVEWLSNHLPDTVDMVLGLTDKDISVTKYKDRKKGIIKEPAWQYRDFGIFGLGRVGGDACVVSSHRLWAKGASAKSFYQRLTRISCHEVGHVLGLHHCPESNCLMNDANESITTIDNSNGVLCEKCWKEIN